MTKSADEDDQLSLQTASPYRTKARHQLIGAFALVATLAILMPLFFHAEPRIPSAEPKAAKVQDEPDLQAKPPEVTTQSAETPTQETLAARSEAADTQPPQKQEAAPAADTPKEPDTGNQRATNPYPELYPDSYVLQAGNFSKKSSAKSQVARLKKLGFKVYTDQVKTPKGERTRVRVGPFDNKAEALQAQGRLRKAKLEAALAGPDH